MALNSLKIASDGYLKRTTKAVLIIAVAGYLNYGATPSPPPPDTGGGGGVTGGTYYEGEEHGVKERKRKTKKDNEFIIEFLKTATNIINNQ